jgi:hypothetical protein
MCVNSGYQIFIIFYKRAVGLYSQSPLVDDFLVTGFFVFNEKTSIFDTYVIDVNTECALSLFSNFGRENVGF